MMETLVKGRKGEERSPSKKLPAPMVSSNQIEKENGGGGGLSRCCLHQGARLPLYAFSKSGKNSGQPSDKEEPQLSFLDLLLKQWEDCKVGGLFHHDISTCETKVIPGEHGFIAFLIENRDLKKRPTEFRIDKVLQPFDGQKFNFTKIGQEEMLFRFEEGENDAAHYIPNAPIVASEPLNVIAINVSPIGHGHVLLLPCVTDCLPQRIDQESFRLAVYMAREAGNPSFRMGYNSLGAFATINHLHFQGFYCPEPFPVEKAPAQTIGALGNGVTILELLQYPVRGLVFEGGKTLQDLADVVSSICIILQNNDHPHNVLISDSGKRIFLLLQCYAEKRSRGAVNQEILETQINPAAWELSGYMVLKRRKDYEEASEEIIIRFLEEASLSAEQFQKMKNCILESLLVGADESSIIRE